MTNALDFHMFGVPDAVLVRARERGVDPQSILALRRDYSDIGASIMRGGSIGVWRLIATLHRLGLG